MAEADLNRIGLIAHVDEAPFTRGFAYLGQDLWQSDRATEQVTTEVLGEAARFTAVPKGTEFRRALDRDGDGALNGDELAQGSDPADAASSPGACTGEIPSAPLGLASPHQAPQDVRLTWVDAASDEAGFALVRLNLQTDTAVTLAYLPANARHYTDITAQAGGTYRYSLVARNCAGSSAPAILRTLAVPLTHSVEVP